MSQPRRAMLRGNADLVYPIAMLTVLDLPLPGPRPIQNQRLFPRIEATFEVFAMDARWEGINLGAGGVLCVGESPVWPGNAVALALRLQGAGTVKSEGKVLGLVAHPRGAAMRIGFERIDATERQRVMQWVARHRASE